MGDGVRADLDTGAMQLTDLVPIHREAQLAMLRGDLVVESSGQLAEMHPPSGIRNAPQKTDRRGGSGAA